MTQIEIAHKMNETIEGNRLIAKFMGAKYAHGYYATNEGVFPGDYCTRLPSELLYHSSWDWIMPAWEKLLDESFKYRVLCRLPKEALLTGDILACHSELVKGIQVLNKVTQYTK